ncbi:hypothetical protein Tco_1205570, partial [Tanacetum coccineum]
ICLRLPDQEFDEPPSEEEILSFIKELGHTGNIKNITAVVVDHMHKPWRTFSSIINKWLSGKITSLDKIRLSRAQILWGMKNPLGKEYAPAKKYVSSKKPSRKQSTGVQIRDTPGVSVSKKKAPAITDKSKGMFFDSENESWGGSRDDDDSNYDDIDNVSDNDGNDDDSDDDGNNDASDDERTESDDDQNDDDKEEEYEDEYVCTLINYESTDDENEHVNEEEYDRIDEELYKDVHAKLKDIDHGEEGKGDAEMTGVGHDNVTQET